ncbi:MAG: thioredoxin family protein [Cyanobacteriota/Melainabacteria group bacterium]
MFFSGASAQDAEGERVKPRLVLQKTALVPGEKVKVGVVFDLAPGWHIYYKEPGDAGMPTSIAWKLPTGFAAGPLLWQKPHRFEESDIITYGYGDTTLIASELTVPDTVKPGEQVEIKADLKWLSCKDVCIPGSAEVKFSFPVASSAEPSAEAASFNSVGFAGSVKELQDEEGKTGNGGTFSVLDSELKSADDNKNEDKGIAYYLAFALVGGFILNFMPCVLPVIAIKVMSFMEQADEEPARVRNLGLVFTAGIISAFMALALIVLTVRAAGQSVGWGFQFQYPGFVIGMCVIVLLLSLSLFGLFYLSFSAGQDELDQLASREGYLGTFFKGVLATTLSTPCTAPFLGAALGFAFAQPPWVVLGIFFASGLGMALPYVVLTAQPQWMKFMPKPGVWMEKFKESMGFVMLATMIWLLGVLASQVGSEGVMWTSFFLLTVALSAWIVSRFTDLGSSSAQKAKVWSVATLVTGLGFYLFIWLQPSIMLGIAGDPTNVGGSALQKNVSTVAGDGTVWQPFSIEGLNKALNEGKTVFLDFTADWCLTCKVNEKTVIDTEPVKKKFKELNVLTMKADWTNRDPDITKLLARFQRSGVPLYVVFPSGRPNEPNPLPDGILTTDTVLKALDQAGPSRSESQ